MSDTITTAEARKQNIEELEKLLERIRNMSDDEYEEFTYIVAFDTDDDHTMVFGRANPHWLLNVVLNTLD